MTENDGYRDKPLNISSLFSGKKVTIFVDIHPGLKIHGTITEIISQDGMQFIMLKDGTHREHGYSNNVPFDTFCVPLDKSVILIESNKK